jgi:hypothetical protein
VRRREIENERESEIKHEIIPVCRRQLSSCACAGERERERERERQRQREREREKERGTKNEE